MSQLTIHLGIMNPLIRCTERIWCYLASFFSAAAAAKSLQSCPTLCDSIDGSAQGSPVPGILQARTLEWVAISFSSAWKWKVKGKTLSCIRLLATPWTAAYQTSPSMGFSRQEYWSGVPLPSPTLILSIWIIITLWILEDYLVMKSLELTDLTAIMASRISEHRALHYKKKSGPRAVYLT